MNDNFLLTDLLGSIDRDTTIERYCRLLPLREELLDFLKREKAVFRDDVTAELLERLSKRVGKETAALFARFLHLYDFNKAKLRELRDLEGTDRYGALAELLRLPGVRRLRAELYFHSGVSLETLAEKPTEEIQSMIRQYVERENRPESVPFTKEVNCHREVAKMILHLNETTA